MSKTFSQVQAQIEKLQREAEVLREKEVAGVVARIRDAIAFYKLEPADIFEGESKVGRASRAPEVRAVTGKRRTGKTVTAANAHRQANRGLKGTKVPVKYRDQAGNEWSGRGSKPRWLVAALDGGKSIESFLVS